jgi:hypothetical protein
MFQAFFGRDVLAGIKGTAGLTPRRVTSNASVALHIRFAACRDLRLIWLRAAERMIITESDDAPERSKS